jgi:glutamate synthase (NADPH/NADH) small chain
MPIDLDKPEMPKQSPEDRISNFDEVALGYTVEMAIKEARRCLQCSTPFCVEGCPVGIDIPGFIKAITEEDFRKSIRILKEKNVLPAICGRVCPQEEQCEKVCVLSKKDAGIAIGRLERFAADQEAREGILDIPPIPAYTGKKIAVVGSGPAGLTVAGDLIKKGHKVTIFEALHEPGGVLVYGIPEFRLPKAILKREVEYLKNLGMGLIFDFVVGRTLSLDELLEEFHAAFLGTGAGLPWFMEIPGENANGIYSANEYLTRSNLMKAYIFPEYDTPIKKGKRVAVIGGGNVAMDAARTALRLGSEEVRIVYRRSRSEMPARDEEIENAEEEGIIFEYLTLPIKFISDNNGWIKEMECLRMELGEPDASGRRRPVPIKGSEFKMPVDVVVVAIGQSPNPLIPSTTPGIEIGKWGNIIVDTVTGRTSKRGVFAGGDVVRGGATVILAMGDARIAAISIDEYLRSNNW